MCYSDITKSWQIRGVLSHQDNCGKSHHPSVYTSINSDIRLWISKVIGEQFLGNL